MLTCLTIAGADPSGGAGIQADIHVFEKLGVRHFSVITALTAQNEKQFLSLHATTPEVMNKQLKAAASAGKIDAVKIGMLATSAILREVTLFLKELKCEHVIVDPVFGSTTGVALLEPSAIHSLREKLLPLASVVTPNIAEAETLSGMKIGCVESMKDAAIKIHKAANNPKLKVIIKGGHLDVGAVDIVFDGTEIYEIKGEYVEGASMHGSGCRYSAAIAVCMARGDDVLKAAKEAKAFVLEELRGSFTSFRMTSG